MKKETVDQTIRALLATAKDSMPNQDIRAVVNAANRLRVAQTMARAINNAVRAGRIDARSPMSDALLDFCDPCELEATHA